jgi:hypothetical protein
MGNHRESLFDTLKMASARLLAEEEGQAILEYMLILMATVVGAGLISQKILQTVDSGILSLGGQLEKDLKTGRAPLDIWKN